MGVSDADEVQLIVLPEAMSSRPSRLALLYGTLSLVRRANVSGWWLALSYGSESSLIAWPAGFRVTSHPPELLNADGDRVARLGDRIELTGGFMPPEEAESRYGDQRVFVSSRARSVREDEV